MSVNEFPEFKVAKTPMVIPEVKGYVYEVLPKHHPTHTHEFGKWLENVGYKRSGPNDKEWVCTCQKCGMHGTRIFMEGEDK